MCQVFSSVLGIQRFSVCRLLGQAGYFEIFTRNSEWRGGQLCLKVNFGLDLKGDIRAQWPVKRGQREQPGQMHVTLRSDVGLFIYTSSPEQSAELQTKKSNCPLTLSFGHLINISDTAWPDQTYGSPSHGSLIPLH